MRKALLALLTLAAALLFTGNPQPCSAGWCPTYPCFARCTPTCVCMSTKIGGGTCVDIQSVQLLEAEGWEVLQ